MCGNVRGGHVWGSGLGQAHRRGPWSYHMFVVWGGHSGRIDSGIIRAAVNGWRPLLM